MIKYKDELLQQIAAGLNNMDRTQLGCIEVVIKTDDAEFDFGLAQALDVLANDLYWDERGDWSQARIAHVRKL